MFYLNYFKNILHQVFIKKRIINCVTLAIIPALLFYSIALYWLKSSGFEIVEILRDPAQQSGDSSFLGFLSNIGVWLWVSAGSISFYSIFTNKFELENNRKRLLLLTGTFSFILAFDDFFMIHDRYISQYLIYFLYGILAFVILFYHHKTIIKIEGFAFLLAGFLLALSISTDVLQYYIPIDYSYLQIFEEGLKFVGAATWLYFNSKVASYETVLEVKIS